MNTLLNQVELQIRSRKLFQPGQSILLAVSGGLDSMVLLHVLHELSERSQWRLMVAHLNHCLRGRNSDADEALVEQRALELGLPAIVEGADIRRFAASKKLSLEMAAREVRHEFLARVAAENGIWSIALAHHADDQIELLFLRLLRGSGGEGLGGMRWRSPSPNNISIALVRPLLDQPKSVLSAYAAARGIKYREDASNRSTDILRNRLRHQLLPLLRRKYQPGLDKTLIRSMDITQAEADLAMRLAVEHMADLTAPRDQRKELPPFNELHLAVQRWCLKLELLRLGVAPEYDLVERLRLVPNTPVAVGLEHLEPSGPAGRARAGESRAMAVIRNHKGILRLQPIPAAPKFREGKQEVALGSPRGTLEFDGTEFKWRIDAKRPVRRLMGVPGREYFDAERVGTAIVLRHWRAGDRFWPIGMPKPVKLQDLFTNQKVLRKRRHDLIIGATAQGEVFWVEGMRISEQFKLTKRTKRCLQWSWQRL